MTNPCRSNGSQPAFRNEQIQGDGAFLICLEREITKEMIKAMADADPSQVICLDEGFKANDQLKANAVQTFKVGCAILDGIPRKHHVYRELRP